MDHDMLVAEQLAAGKRLIETLTAAQFDVRLAFWAWPAELEEWRLYLASPSVEEQGLQKTYLRLHEIIRQNPELGIDPFDVRLIGMTDSLTEAALATYKPKPYPAMSRFRRTVLGVDGGYVYPPIQPAATA